MFLFQRVIFNIVNFSKTKSLYRDGMSPLVKSTSRQKWFVFDEMVIWHVYISINDLDNYCMYTDYDILQSSSFFWKSITGLGYQQNMFTTTDVQTTGKIMWCPSPFVLIKKTMYTSLDIVTHTHILDFKIIWIT